MWNEVLILILNGLYLLDSSGQKYKKLQLLNKEFTFDVKVSDLDCGLNGALYLVEMDADGGLSYSGINWTWICTM